MIHQALLSHSGSCGEDRRYECSMLKCQELSLSMDAFSRSHDYDRSVGALGPNTIQH